MAITLRSTKGSALTWAEMDTNFTELSANSVGATSQTWTDMLLPTVQRAVNVPYTNNTGKPIMVNVSIGAGVPTITIDGVALRGGTGRVHSTLSVIIPPNASYTVTGGTIAAWAELL